MFNPVSLLPVELRGLLNSVPASALDGSVRPFSLPREGKWAEVGEVSIPAHLRAVMTILHDINVQIYGLRDCSAQYTTDRLAGKPSSRKTKDGNSRRRRLRMWRALLLAALRCQFEEILGTDAPKFLEGDMFIVSDGDWKAKIYRYRSASMDKVP